MSVQAIQAGAKQLIDVPLGVGESPVWDERRNVLLFVDITAPALFAYDPATANLQRWAMPSPIGSLGLCDDGRAIVALKSGVHFFDLATGRLDLLVAPEPDRPYNRLNDGKVGPDDMDLIMLTDDVEEAVQIIVNAENGKR